MDIDDMSNEDIKERSDYYGDCRICGRATCDENLGELNSSKGVCCDNVDCMKKFEMIGEI